MTALEASHASQDTDFRDRVEHFLVKSSVAITNENPATPLHTERISLANKILSQPNLLVDRACLITATTSQVLSQPTFASVTDANLELAVNSIYNAMLNIKL